MPHFDQTFLEKVYEMDINGLKEYELIRLGLSLCFFLFGVAALSHCPTFPSSQVGRTAPKVISCYKCLAGEAYSNPTNRAPIAVAMVSARLCGKDPGARPMDFANGPMSPVAVPLQAPLRRPRRQRPQRPQQRPRPQRQLLSPEHPQASSHPLLAEHVAISFVRPCALVHGAKRMECVTRAESSLRLLLKFSGWNWWD